MSIKGTSGSLSRKLKMGMVGGGPGAFIGEVHRKAARMDGGVDVVAGAFDINPRKSKQMGKQLCLDPKRTYRTYTEMIEKELKLPAGERIDFVAVCVPNNWHFPIARDFLKAGFNVMCEKPMTLTVAEARQLKKIVKETKKVFGRQLLAPLTPQPLAPYNPPMPFDGKELARLRKAAGMIQAELAEAVGVSPADLHGPKQQPRDFSGLAHEADSPAAD